MHPCYKALHWQRPALEGENPPANPSLGTGGPTPTLCSWEVSLIEGCQPGDAQRQSRGSRHPVESRRTPASLVSLTHSNGFTAPRFFFPAASPVLLLALPPPAPSSTFFALPVGFSSPRRRGLHGTHAVKATPGGFLQSYMDVRAARPVHEKTSAGSTGPALSSPACGISPSPSAPALSSLCQVSGRSVPSVCQC